jgi:outer membrane protein TolC
MRIKFATIISTFLLLTIFVNAVAQQLEEITLNLTLDQAIDLAQKQSIESFKNKNMYLSRYWEFRSYKAQNLPSLGLSSTPFDYSKSNKLQYNSKDSTESFVPSEMLNSGINLSLKQNITATGAVISANSNFMRIDNFQQNLVSLSTTPISIAITQPINGYNSFRWNSRIEPVKFEIAKREFIQSIEDISIVATENFFQLVSAEINLNIAETNYHNADTLYRIAKGRFEIGTVTQDELLDFELGLLNSKIELTKSKLNLQQSKFTLNNFLGLEKNVSIKCIVPYKIENNDLEIDNVMALAIENNPQVLGFNQQLLEANRKIAETRGSSGLAASVKGNFGIERHGDLIEEVYQPPFDEQRGLSVSFTLPIIDWGKRKGDIMVAKSDRDVVEATIKQGRIEFEQNVFQQVMEFNLQDEQVAIAYKADTIAQMGYEVTKQRFLIGKIDVIKLNAARNSLGAARRNSVDALRRYWNNYYTMRRLTLYDFEQNISLMQELDYLLEK